MGRYSKRYDSDDGQVDDYSYNSKYNSGYKDYGGYYGGGGRYKSKYSSSGSRRDDGGYDDILRKNLSYLQSREGEGSSSRRPSKYDKYRSDEGSEYEDNGRCVYYDEKFNTSNGFKAGRYSKSKDKNGYGNKSESAKKQTTDVKREENITASSPVSVIPTPQTQLEEPDNAYGYYDHEGNFYEYVDYDIDEYEVGERLMDDSSGIEYICELLQDGSKVLRELDDRNALPVAVAPPPVAVAPPPVAVFAPKAVQGEVNQSPPISTSSNSSEQKPSLRKSSMKSPTSSEDVKKPSKSILKKRKESSEEEGDDSDDEASDRDVPLKESKKLSKSDKYTYLDTKESKLSAAANSSSKKESKERDVRSSSTSVTETISSSLTRRKKDVIVRDNDESEVSKKLDKKASKERKKKTSESDYTEVEIEVGEDYDSDENFVRKRLVRTEKIDRQSCFSAFKYALKKKRRELKHTKKMFPVDIRVVVAFLVGWICLSFAISRMITVFRKNSLHGSPPSSSFDVFHVIKSSAGSVEETEVTGDGGQGGVRLTDRKLGSDKMVVTGLTFDKSLENRYTEYMDRQRLGLMLSQKYGKTVNNSDEILKENGSKQRAFGYSTLVSDLLPTIRMLPDSRHAWCKSQFDTHRQPKSIGNVVIKESGFSAVADLIMCVMDPDKVHWSVLERSLKSLERRTPSHLYEHVVLIVNGVDPHGDDKNHRVLLPKLKQFVNSTGGFSGKVRVEMLKEKHTLLSTCRTEAVMKIVNSIATKLIFLDPEVEVNKGWLEPLLSHVSSKERRRWVVYPEVDVVDANTFQYQFNDALHDLHVGAFDWDLEFKWLKVMSREKREAHQRTTIVEMNENKNVSQKIEQSTTPDDSPPPSMITASPILPSLSVFLIDKDWYLELNGRNEDGTVHESVDEIGENEKKRDEQIQRQAVMKNSTLKNVHPVPVSHPSSGQKNENHPQPIGIRFDDPMEFSFKIWMCGGRIEVIPCSRVGQIFKEFESEASPILTASKNTTETLNVVVQNENNDNSTKLDKQSTKVNQTDSQDSKSTSVLAESSLSNLHHLASPKVISEFSSEDDEASSLLRLSMKRAVDFKLRSARKWMTGSTFGRNVYKRFMIPQKQWDENFSNAKLQRSLRLQGNQGCRNFKWYLANVYPQLLQDDAIHYGELRSVVQQATRKSGNDEKSDQAKSIFGNSRSSPFCVESQGGLGSAILTECTGFGGNQYWEMSKDGRIHQNGDFCLTAHVSEQGSSVVIVEECIIRAEETEKSGKRKVVATKNAQFWDFVKSETQKGVEKHGSFLLQLRDFKDSNDKDKQLCLKRDYSTIDSSSKSSAMLSLVKCEELIQDGGVAHESWSFHNNDLKEY